MRTVLNTLFVFSRGAYLRLEGDTVVVLIEREKRHQVPLHHLEAISVFGEVGISPSLISRCGEDGRSIVFHSHYGEFQARVEGPISGNVHLRLDQFRSNTDGDKALNLCKSFIAGKIKNTRQVVLRTGRDTVEKDEIEQLRKLASHLAMNLKLLEKSDSIDQARGYEGESAKRYFETMPLHLRYDQRVHFPFKGRSKRPPRDSFNAILSFIYTLLMSDCRSALEAVGLDPQIGFLHQVRPGRAALALDLCEEFRPVLADRLAFTLINRQQVQGTNFDFRDGGAVYLNEEGRKKVVGAYQARKQETVKHPLLKEPVPIGVLPYIQARLLARVIRGDVPTYIPFVYK